MASLAVVANPNSSLISAIRNLISPLCGAQHDGVSMSRVLSQRLASGVGAGNARCIKE
jgi:hypothetical protein